MIKFIIFFIQLFFLIFLTSYLTINSFDIIFEIKELQYAFSSNVLRFFILAILLLSFLLQLIYIKSRYKYDIFKQSI